MEVWLVLKCIICKHLIILILWKINYIINKLVNTIQPSTKTIIKINLIIKIITDRTTIYYKLIGILINLKIIIYSYWNPKLRHNAI